MAVLIKVDHLSTGKNQKDHFEETLKTSPPIVVNGAPMATNPTEKERIGGSSLATSHSENQMEKATRTGRSKGDQIKKANSGKALPTACLIRNLTARKENPPSVMARVNEAKATARENFVH